MKQYETIVKQHAISFLLQESCLQQPGDSAQRHVSGSRGSNQSVSTHDFKLCFSTIEKFHIHNTVEELW